MAAAMSNNRFILLLAVVACVSALAGYYGVHTSGNAANAAMQAARAQAPEVATTTLPDKTRSAWVIHDYGLSDLDGVKHALSDWRGKVILMNFWATWCQPCQYEIPRLVALQKQYGDKGLQIVSYGLDERDKLKNVARSLMINYPVLVVPGGLKNKLLAKWGSASQIIPHSVVIDRDGEIRYIHRGMIDEDAIELYLLPLLSKKGNTP